MSYYTILFVFLIYSDVQQSQLPSFLRPTSILIYLSRYLTQRLKNLTSSLLHSLICHFLNQIIEFSHCVWNNFISSQHLCVFMCMYMCACECASVYMRVCLCVWVWMWLCMCVCVYVCMYVCVRKSLFASDLYFSNAHTLWESERYYDNI